MKFNYILIIFFTFSLIFLSSLISNVNAENVNYNPNCTFYPKIYLNNYTMNLYGLDEFNKSLVQNTQGYITLDIKILGNWSDLSDMPSYIVAFYSIHCHGQDNKDEILGGSGGAIGSAKTFLEDGKVITEFSWNNSFIVPEKRFCYAIGQIFGYNETWASTSNCNDNCICWVLGLSNTPLLTSQKNVITLQEFLLEKQLEEQKSQGDLNTQVKNLTIVIFLLSLITLFVSKDFIALIKKNRYFWVFMTLLITGFFMLNNLPKNNPINLILSGITALWLIAFSFVTLSRYFIPYEKLLPYISKLSITSVLFPFYLISAILLLNSITTLLFSKTDYISSGIMALLSFIALIATYYLLLEDVNNITSKKVKQKINNYLCKNKFIKKIKKSI